MALRRDCPWRIDMKKARKPILIAAVGIAFFPLGVGAQGAAGYKGGGACEGARLEVTFNYDAKAATITDFKASHGCSAAEGKGIEWSAKEPVKVGNGGAFEHKDRYGNFVKGSIAAGKASGELSKPPFKLSCGKSGSVSACTQWTASPAK
jgi:hypothetical protein